MIRETVKINKKAVYALSALLVALILSSIAILNPPQPNFYVFTSTRNMAGSETKFVELSAQNTNQCSGSAFIDFEKDGSRLQGSCCGAMDFHRYSEQVEGLKKYSNIDKIPSDPYDIPVSLAKELLEYQKSINLTQEQQSTYDEAVNLSHEGGPCCCKCWRWYAFEGLAKYLITEHSFNSEQIADVWDLEDGCGGTGHTGHH